MDQQDKSGPAFTPGPWRWEFNREHRSVHLVGGVPEFDLTVMEFTRWGMSGAGISLRDLAHDGMNLMHKLHERDDWIAPFPRRAHHAHWCADVVHPDMRLIAAAPDLYEACQALLDVLDRHFYVQAREGTPVKRARDALAKATGSQQ